MPAEAAAEAKWNKKGSFTTGFANADRSPARFPRATRSENRPYIKATGMIRPLFGSSFGQGLLPSGNEIPPGKETVVSSHKIRNPSTKNAGRPVGDASVVKKQAKRKNEGKQAIRSVGSSFRKRLRIVFSLFLYKPLLVKMISFYLCNMNPIKKRK